MGFLNPLLIWGTALVGVPILIYLVNRQRYLRRPWAAMEFLLRALKKQRRRIQIENLLLLAIRVSVILLLALACARPYMKSVFMAISPDKEDNWIFAIDTSWSMGFKEGPRNAFERSREMITDMIQGVVKPRDRVAIMTLDAEPRVVKGPEGVQTDRARLLGGLGDVALGTRSVDLLRSFETIRELATRFEPAGEGGPAILPKKIVLFSDFQRKDWLGEAGPRDPAVLGLIKEIQDAGGQFALADLKTADRNLSILDLSVSPEVIARNVWIQLKATVHNWSREDFDRVELVFHVDGQEEVGLILRVPAGETATSPSVPYRFSEAGYHAVSAEIRSDGLALDNRRFLAVRVREDAAVLLVDGEPGGSPLERETLQLGIALSPDPTEAQKPAEGRMTPYHPVLRTADQLDDVDPREYSLVVLANVSYFPERFLRDLKAYVRDGGALLVFLGKNIDPVYYGQEFGGEGGALLPGRLGEVVGDARASFHLVPADPGHPLVRYFEERREVTHLFEPLVEFKQFYRCVLPQEPPADPRKAAGPSGARVAFRFSDPEGSPAVLDCGFGMGRVMWVTTTADTEWNEFAKWPDFIAFLYETIPYLVRFGEARINLGVGEPFRQVFEASDYAPSCVLIPPDPQREAGLAAGGSPPGTFSKAMTKLEGENRFVITHEETWSPGIYELRLSRPGAPGTPARDSRQCFAVNIDPREGDLRPILSEELREHFQVLKAERFDPERELRKIGGQKSLAPRSELWRTVLWAALLLLLAETALAQFLGRRER